MFVHAYQSSIFNQTIDMRLRMGEKLHVPLVGDNVIPIDNYGGPDQRRVIEVTEYNQKKLKKRCREGKAWVVGLLPGLESKYTKGLQGDLEKNIMNDGKISFKDYQINEIPNFTSLGMHRPLCQKINNLEWEIDRKGDIILNFWLHKGTYATSFLREIMKAKDVRAY